MTELSTEERALMEEDTQRAELQYASGGNAAMVWHFQLAWKENQTTYFDYRLGHELLKILAISTGLPVCGGMPELMKEGV